MKRRISATLILFFIIVTFIPAFTPVEAEAGRNYRSELRRVTKKAGGYDFTTWDAKLIWHATLFTDQFRQAQSAKHVELYRLGPRAAARSIVEQSKAQEEGWEFFISIYTKKDFKKFDATDDSFWHAELTTSSGEKVQPTNVALVPITPNIEVLYPHVNRWSKTYRVIFPKVDIGERPQLTLWSVVGASTLKWRLH